MRRACSTDERNDKCTEVMAGKHERKRPTTSDTKVR